jgi:hypothetical protein
MGFTVSLTTQEKHMNEIKLSLTDDQVNYLFDALEMHKATLIKERNKVRDVSEIDANQLAQLTAKIWTMQNIRKQII